VRSGIVLVDKPSGMSSARVVSRVKKALGARKVGHAGTLDPGATGLLVCLLNSATRLASFAESGSKVYTGEIELGVRTSSDDLDGDILERSDALPSFEEVEKFLPQYIGQIAQVPPAVSAVKIDGKRAYAIARKGEQVILQPRQVHVERFTLSPLSRRRLNYSVLCSKGTYIRSLARDLGEDLGCGGAIATLRREESFPFSVEEACQLDDVSWEHVISWERLFPNHPRLVVTKEEALALSGGDERVLRAVTATTPAPEVSNLSPCIIYTSGEGGPGVGLLRWQDNCWKFGVNLGLVAE